MTAARTRSLVTSKVQKPAVGLLLLGLETQFVDRELRNQVVVDVHRNDRAVRGAAQCTPNLMRPLARVNVLSTTRASGTRGNR